ncbi:MAG TPA: hypothetical protein PKH54_01300 [Myxococcota bacterium]|nr:hypothetical protein [Myxococcota bacterium]HOA13430.1 hypothetical protein [Myxococcota bacterium]HOC98550.1 hypothetical protein [Myxococcota bacterium]HOH76615.1 hypothetical protein [Myxococcota bacterium]HPV03686.1 hypothetical protein [Myxococcota bacterium]
MKKIFVLILALAAAGCGAGETGSDVLNDVARDAVSDVAADTAGDVAADTAGDVAGDVAADISAEVADDVASDTADDAGPDTGSGWKVPAEEWSSCPQVEYIGSKTLAQKAAYYDWAGMKLHQKPWDAPGHEDYSTVYEINCDADVPTEIVPDGQIPNCVNPLSENTGLWTSLYVASQAFRYATTHEAEALATLKRTLNGTYHQLLITGTPGLYTRDMRDPTLPSQFCVEDEEPYKSAATDNGKYARYVPRPDDTMVGNQFVRVDTDGCFLTWDPALNEGAGGWLRHENYCTDPKFAGFCWQDNASKDEYAGHMFAAGIVAMIVDDADVRAMAVDILRSVAMHMVEHDFMITDYDGRRTRFGSAFALAFDEAPGGNAVMALSWIRMAATVTGDQVLIDTYYDCLLQMSGKLQCIEQPFEWDSPADYTTYFADQGMDLAKGSKSNYDTINIALLNWFNLVWFEPGRDLRDIYRQAFRDNTYGPDREERDLWDQANPFFNFSVVSRMESDDYDQTEVKKLVEDSVCTLKQFPTDNIRRAKDSTVYPEWKVSPRHGSLAESAIPISERCSSVFEWWGDPNSRETCAENLRNAEPPAGYLLPYWMGRYFGFISQDL